MLQAKLCVCVATHPPSSVGVRARFEVCLQPCPVCPVVCPAVHLCISTNHGGKACHNFLKWHCETNIEGGETYLTKQPVSHQSLWLVFYPGLYFSRFPLKIACKSSRFFFQIYFYHYKITVYTADLYFKHDSWRSRACLPVEAAAKAMIDQFPWLQTLDTAAIARQSKSADDIIRSATFPAAHAPSPDDSSQSEGISWPYALSVLGTVSSGWACSLCCLLAVHRALRHSLAALISLQQRLNCIPALLWAPAVSRVSSVFCFTFCMHRAEMSSLILVSALFCAWGDFFFFSCHIIFALASHISATNDLDRDHWDWLQTQYCLVCRTLRKHSKIKTRVMKRTHPLQTPPVCLSRQLCLSFVFLSVLYGSKISSCIFCTFRFDVPCKTNKKKAWFLPSAGVFLCVWCDISTLICSTCRVRG